LHKDLEEMAQTVRAKLGRKLPTVLSVAEVLVLLDAVEPEFALMVRLLYGGGLRLMEFAHQGHRLRRRVDRRRVDRRSKRQRRQRQDDPAANIAA